MEHSIIPGELLDIIWYHSLPYMKCILRRVCHYTSQYTRSQYGSKCVLDVAASHGDASLVQWLHLAGTPFSKNTLSCAILNNQPDVVNYLIPYIPLNDRHHIDYIAMGIVNVDVIQRIDRGFRTTALVNAFQSQNYDVLMQVSRLTKQCNTVDGDSSWLTNIQLMDVLTNVKNLGDRIITDVVNRDDYNLIQLMDLSNQKVSHNLLLHGSLSLIILSYITPQNASYVLARCMEIDRLDVVHYIIDKYNPATTTVSLGIHNDNRRTLEYGLSLGYRLTNNLMINDRYVMTCNTAMFDYAVENGLNPHTQSTFLISLEHRNYDIIDRMLIDCTWIYDTTDKFQLLVNMVDYMSERVIHDGYIHNIRVHLLRMDYMIRSRLLKKIHSLSVEWVINNISNTFFPIHSLFAMCMKVDIQKMDILYKYGWKYTGANNIPEYSRQWLLDHLQTPQSDHQ